MAASEGVTRRHATGKRSAAPASRAITPRSALPAAAPRLELVERVVGRRRLALDAAARRPVPDEILAVARGLAPFVLFHPHEPLALSELFDRGMLEEGAHIDDAPIRP